MAAVLTVGILAGTGLLTIAPTAPAMDFCTVDPDAPCVSVGIGANACSDATVKVCLDNFQTWQAYVIRKEQTASVGASVAVHVVDVGPADIPCAEAQAGYAEFKPSVEECSTLGSVERTIWSGSEWQKADDWNGATNNIRYLCDADLTVKAGGLGLENAPVKVDCGIKDLG